MDHFDCSSPRSSKKLGGGRPPTRTPSPAPALSLPLPPSSRAHPSSTASACPASFVFVFFRSSHARLSLDEMPLRSLSLFADLPSVDPPESLARSPLAASWIGRRTGSSVASCFACSDLD
ncbi:hypothetical protein Cni_G17183 [Canna indica]|uniref:Uncharacterized protein n=1 Tax=Canna indica TaxID=4628 RepID=A0AAQ3QHH8_9LILI|nr:hypothetical protein Cni_G17183 [Canna indica]